MSAHHQLNTSTPVAIADRSKQAPPYLNRAGTSREADAITFPQHHQDDHQISGNILINTKHRKN